MRRTSTWPLIATRLVPVARSFSFFISSARVPVPFARLQALHNRLQVLDAFAKAAHLTRSRAVCLLEHQHPTRRPVAPSVLGGAVSDVGVCHESPSEFEAVAQIGVDPVAPDIPCWPIALISVLAPYPMWVVVSGALQRGRQQGSCPAAGDATSGVRASRRIS